MKFYCETCKTVFDIGFPIVKEKGKWKPDYKQEYISGGTVVFDGYCPYHGCLLQPIPDYETPEQYEKRTGKPYPDDGAVWFRIPDDPSDSFNNWTLLVYADALQYERESEEADYAPTVFTVIADPPVPPPDNWRPV